MDTARVEIDFGDDVVVILQYTADSRAVTSCKTDALEVQAAEFLQGTAEVGKTWSGTFATVMFTVTVAGQ